MEVNFKRNTAFDYTKNYGNFLRKESKVSKRISKKSVKYFLGTRYICF